MRDWKKKPKYKQTHEQTYEPVKRQSRKKKAVINSQPIISLIIGLGILSVALLTTMFSVRSSGRHDNKLTGDTKQEQEAKETQASLTEVLGVVTDINEESREITLYDISRKESTAYPYSGGTDIVDKYGQTIAMRQLPIGTMVEAAHPKNGMKLTQLKISTKAWEYVGVNNLSIDRSSRVMKIGSSKYKYIDDLIILNGTDFITVYDLAPMDELTVRGYEETIWSITVTRGHGTVKLVDYEGFLGDFITIGYEAIQQIARDMIIMVREGNFNLTVESAKYTATKNITIYRNQETVVTLGDLGPNASKQGRVTFTISPFGADLFVDGKLTTYAGALELNYGKHDIVVSLDGYVTYEGILTVDTAGKNLRIDLPKESSNREATVTETNTETTDNAGSNTNTNTGTNPDPNTGSNANPNTNTNPDVNTNPNANTGTDAEDDIPIVDSGGDDNTQTPFEEDYEVDEDHLIYVQNPVGASVYLNGEFQGISPASFRKVIGAHVLTFIKDGYETTSYSVEVADDHLDTYFNMPDLVKKK